MATVFNGRVFSVEVGELTFPNGQRHAVEIVRHAPSVVLIPIEDDGRIVLIKQFRAPLGREIWEFPAGRVEPGESVEDAACRECEEEIGRMPQRLERIRGLFPTPGFCDEELIFFKISGLRAAETGAARQRDADEYIVTKSLAVGEAREMLTRGEIVDLKTAYALTLLD
jgi:ADP-ribose diphosphatase